MKKLFILFLILLFSTSVSAKKINDLPDPSGGIDVTNDWFHVYDMSVPKSAKINVNDLVTAFLTGRAISVTELDYLIGGTEPIQTALDVRCLESVLGTSINTDDLQLNGEILETANEIPHIDTTQTWLANQKFTDGIGIKYGANEDGHEYYDESGSDELECHFNSATDKYRSLINDHVTGKAYYKQNNEKVLDESNLNTPSSPGYYYLISAGNVTTDIQKVIITSSRSLTALEMRGGVVYIQGDITVTIPVFATGNSVTIHVDGPYDAVIELDNSDAFRLNGVLLTAGNQLDSSGTAGDTLTLKDHSSGVMYANAFGFTDGGA